MNTLANDPATSQRAQRRAILALVVALLLWGVHFPLSKYVTRRVDPFAIAGLRILFGAVAFSCLIGRRRLAALGAGRWIRTFLPLALTGIVVNQVGFIVGIAHTTPGHSAVLMAMIPLFIALLARFLLGERAAFRVWCGILMGGAGAFGVVMSSAPAERAATLRGDLFTLAATLAFAYFTVRSRGLVQREGSRTCLAGCYVAAVPFGIGLLIVGLADQGPVEPAALAGLAYLLVVSTFLCYLLYFAALRILPAVRSAPYINLQPVFGTAFSAMAGMEPLGGVFLGSAVVVLVGVFLAQSAQVQEDRAPGCRTLGK